MERALLEEVGGVEVLQVQGVHTDLLTDLAHQAILEALTELQSTARELGDPLSLDQLIGNEYAPIMHKQAVDAEGECHDDQGIGPSKKCMER
jgi:hypothetical protein